MNIHAKNYYFLSFALLFLHLPSAYSSDWAEYEIRLKNRTFTPAQSANLVAATRHDSTQKQRVLMQFFQLPTVDKLAQMGIQPLHQVSSTTLAVSFDAPLTPEAQAIIRWVGNLTAQDKLSPQVGIQLRDARDESFVFLVEIFPDVAATQVHDLALKFALEVVPHASLPAHLYLLKGSKHAFLQLAERTEIAWISVPVDALLAGEPSHYCAGSVTDYGLVASYSTYRVNWVGGVKKPLLLKYHFINGTLDILDEQEQIAVVSAMREWAKYASVYLLPTTIAGQPRSIDIGWYTGEHADRLPFDGTGGDYSHIWHPPPINPEPLAGDWHFDDDEQWALEITGDPLFSPERHLFTAAMHDFGHILGLDHSDVAGSVMQSFYSGPKPGLHADDIAAVQSLYPATTPQPYALRWGDTASQKTEIVTFSVKDNLQTISSIQPIPLPMAESDSDQFFFVANYNADISGDLFVVQKNIDGSAYAQIKILDGASNFTKTLLHVDLPIAALGTQASNYFALADFNADERIDLYSIVKPDELSSATEITVFDGAKQFQSTLTVGSTALVAAGGGNRFDFKVVDMNQDIKPDLVVVDRSTAGTGFTSVSVLNGASGFYDYLMVPTAITLQNAGLDNKFEFELGHFDYDGVYDLYILQTIATASGLMELRVLSGVDQFQTTLQSNVTALKQNSISGKSAFVLASNNTTPAQMQRGGCSISRFVHFSTDLTLPFFLLGSIAALWGRNKKGRHIRKDEVQ